MTDANDALTILRLIERSKEMMQSLTGSIFDFARCCCYDCGKFSLLIRTGLCIRKSSQFGKIRREQDLKFLHPRNEVRR